MSATNFWIMNAMISLGIVVASIIEKDKWYSILGSFILTLFIWPVLVGLVVGTQIKKERLKNNKEKP